MSTDWQIDELAHAGDDHLDAAFVADYDAKQQTDPAEDVETLLDLGVDGTTTVVDLGCGTGTFSTAIAPHVHRVLAADVSPAMVAYLRRRVADTGVDNVTVVQAGFMSYRHDGPPADVLYTRNALHQIPDFHKGIALARFATVLRSGGILFLRDLVYDFEPDQADEAIAAWFAGAVAPPTPGYTAEDLALHVRTEYSTYRFCLDALLAHTGFAVREATFRRRVYARYLCERAH
jgi:ubiquinone/menaquinone biosynthesis C-methylase UbiE